MPSPQVLSLLSLLEEFSGSPLNQPEDFAEALQRGHDRGLHDIIGRLAFHGRYCARLLRTRASQGPTSEFTAQLDRELQTGLGEFHALLSLLFINADDAPATTIRRRYALPSSPLHGDDPGPQAPAPTIDTLSSLIGIARDFSVLKAWELEMSGAGEA